MSKQNKGLAGFGAVAGHATKNSNEKETNITTNHNMNTGSNNMTPANINNALDADDEHVISNPLHDILHSVTNKPKTIKKRQISAYIDEAVAKKLDKFGKEYGKGAKSDLINNFLKSALK